MNASEQARKDANNGIQPRTDIPKSQQAAYTTSYQDQAAKNGSKK